MSNTHLDELIRYYSRITQFPKEYQDVFKIDKPMRWLLADKREQYVSISKKSDLSLFEIDITSCFPTVCMFLFSDENPKFIENINQLDNKLEKNIYIANSLKNTPYLKILNIVSKIVILGYIFDRQDSNETNLLEFEKDGCLILTSDQTIEKEIITSKFQEFVVNAGFRFHIKKYDYYIRCNNTSWYWNDFNKILRLKGIYKHIPIKIKSFYNDLFQGKISEIDKINNVYNQDYWKFIKRNNLINIIENYYYCDDQKKVLNSNGKYEKFMWHKSDVDSRLYLYTFIYPLWLFYRRNLHSIC
jgi:hypothetical protein